MQAECPGPRRSRCVLSLATIVRLAVAATTALPGVPATASCRDPGEQTRVSLAMCAASLRELLAELSRQTGARHQCSPDLERLRISAYVRSLPIDTLRIRLAELLHLTWRQAAPGSANETPTFLLYRSAGDSAEERRLAEQGERAFRDAFLLGVRAAAASPAESGDIPSHSQLAATLGDPRARTSLSLIGRMSPDQRDRILRGEPLSIPVRSLDGAEREAVQTLSRAARSTAPAPEALRVWRDGTGADSGIILELAGNGWRKGHRVHVTSRSEAYDRTGGSEKRSADDDAPGKMVQIKTRLSDASFDRLIEKLATSTGANILAESYHDFAAYPMAVAPGGASLDKLLDDLLLADRVWWKRGGVYLIQKRFWFLDRQAQVDLDLVQRLRRAKRERGLSLEEWAELGRLTPKQWMALQSLGLGEFDMMLPDHALLSFYAHLPRLQRAALFARSGIDSRHLLPADIARLRLWLAWGLDGAEPAGALPPAAAVRVAAIVADGTTTVRAWIADPESGGRLIRTQRISAVPRSRWSRQPATGAKRR